ncbi:hypothetical protein AAON49_04515 [Pseudotenacibaculum sp. MALMAid0570]|uniref:hypothetical protein n=1 Tax=Pseudotenacibaculum sp. MALMAid0570 TaxID=3143938 RepID=UPI0032DE3832
MNINRVIVAGVFSFPTGQAASSRILNLTRGFMDHVDDVQVICSYYNEDGKEFKQKGHFQFCNKSIPFIAMAPHVFEGNSIIKRVENRLSYYKVTKLLVNSILETLEGHDKEMIFTYGRSYTFLNLLLKKIKKKNYKTKIVFDVVEPPMVKNSRIEYIKHPFLWESSLVFKKLLPKFSACTFITYKLKEEYGKAIDKFSIVPSVLYSKEKKGYVKFNDNELVIGYFGALINKDYPQLLYNLCLDLYNKEQSFKLRIIGRFRNFSEGREWEKRFVNSPFKNSVSLHFNPSEKEKMELLRGVKFLVLFRKPEPLQEFTFPTRVVEVLGLHKVLIMNSFGDLPRYFIDLKNCIFLPSNELRITSEKLIRSNNNNTYTKLVKEASKLLENDFNSSIQAKEILNQFL